MSTFVDYWGTHHARATVTVLADTPSAKVTWYAEDGKRFRAIVRQKPNPIGFHVRLPGDGSAPK